MSPYTRYYIPRHINPENFLPGIQPVEQLFSKPPYLFQDFVGKALAFLQTKQIQDLGFELDFTKTLPCKWKCADESLFAVDLILYAYTGKYPFDKGSLGGFFNPDSVSAAVHHAPINVDFGGSHVGYQPDETQGKFGSIPRPLNQAKPSSDCGYLCKLLGPFKEVYQDACENILTWNNKEKLLLSIPNEYLHPAWTSNGTRLIVNLQTMISDTNPLDTGDQEVTTAAGRSVFYASDRFKMHLSSKAEKVSPNTKPKPIGPALSAEYFYIFDSQEKKNRHETANRLLSYMSDILSQQNAPPELMAALVHSNLEYNKLTDTIRKALYRPYSFASFTGIFIDIHDDKTGEYVNLFQPVGLTIKPAGASREIEVTAKQLRETFDAIDPVDPFIPLEHVLGYKRPAQVLDQFTYGAK